MVKVMLLMVYKSCQKIGDRAGIYWRMDIFFWRWRWIKALLKDIDVYKKTKNENNILFLENTMYQD